jgi:hypothetical protein
VTRAAGRGRRWLVAAVVLAAVAGGGAAWLWGEARQMRSLAEHPALDVVERAGIEASAVSVYERAPSMWESVGLVRITYASDTDPVRLAEQVEAALDELAAGAGVARQAAIGDRRRWGPWAHGVCTHTIVSAHVDAQDPRHDLRLETELEQAGPGSRSWLQLTARGCGGSW